MLAQLILSGLATGSLYALTSVAIVLIFRNTRTINLAQGDFSMIGAFVALIFLKQLNLPYLAAFAATVVCVTLLAAVHERLVMRRIAESDWLTLFTATIGVLYILHGLAGWLWGRDTKSFPRLFSMKPISIGGALISQAHLFNMIIAAGIGLLLNWAGGPGLDNAVLVNTVASPLMEAPGRVLKLLQWRCPPTHWHLQLLRQYLQRLLLPLLHKARSVPLYPF